MPNPFLSAISVPPSICPVVEDAAAGDNDGKHSRHVWFNMNPWVLWSYNPEPKDGNGPKTNVAAREPIVLAQFLESKAASLLIDVVVPAQTVGKFKVACTGGLRRPWTSTTFETAAQAKASIQRVMIPFPAPTTSAGVQRPLPWIYDDKLNVSLFRVQPGNIETKLELEAEFTPDIYVVPTALSPIYIDTGIPRRLLTFDRLLPVWKNMDDAVYTTNWEAFVINVLTNLPGIHYNVWTGTSRYTSMSTEQWNTKYYKLGCVYDCWLDLFLSDQIGLAARRDTTTKYALTCYDTSAITQCFFFLGIPHQTCQAIWLEPYGCINETKLIGCVEPDRNRNPPNPDNKCNNPYYANPLNDPRMLLPNRDDLKPGPHRKRGYFGNHMFLAVSDGSNNAQNSFIWDACAGPCTGTIRKQDYCNRMIDRDATTVLGLKAGTTQDMIPGSGLIALAQSTNFANRNAAEQTVLDEAFNRQFPIEKGILYQPYLGVLSSIRAMVAVYTFKPVPKNGEAQDTVTITVFFYTYDNQALEAWNMRASTTPNFTVENGNTDKRKRGYTDQGQGSIRVLYMQGKDSDKRSSMLVTIESDRRKARDLVTTENDVKVALKTAKLEREKSDAAWKDVEVFFPHFEDPDVKPPLGQKRPAVNPKHVVGEYFEILIKAPYEENKNSWRGYQVRCKDGGLLLLQGYSDVNPEKTEEQLRFVFLARKPGEAKIELQLYNGALQSWPVKGYPKEWWEKTCTITPRPTMRIA